MKQGRLQSQTAVLAAFLFRACVRHSRVGALLFISVLISMVIYTAGHLRTEVSLEGLLGDDHPATETYQKFMSVFGHDQIFVYRYRDADLLTTAGLKRLAALQTSLSALDSAVLGVSSILDYPVQDVVDGQVIMGSAHDLVTSGRVFDVGRWVSDRPALSRFLSPDRTETLLLLMPAAGQQSTVPDSDALVGLLSASERFVERFNSDADVLLGAGIEPGTESELQGTREQVLIFAGQGAFLGLVQRLMLNDLYFLPLVSVLLSLGLLFIIFRRITGVLLPVMIVIPPVIFALFLMALLEIPVRVSSVLIPPVLIVIGIASSVHVLTAFYQGLRPGINQLKLMETVISNKAPALFTATLTTAMAFAVFYSVPLAAVSELGLVAAIGTLVILPVLVVISALYISIISMSGAVSLRCNSERATVKSDSVILRIYQWFNHWAILAALRFPKLIVAIAIVLFSVGIYGVKEVKLSHQPGNWLPSGHSLSTSSRNIEENFTVSLSLDIFIDSGRQGGVLEPDFMKLMKDVRRLLADSQNVMQGISVAEASALSLSDFYRYRLMAPDQMSRMISDDYRYARLSVRVPMREGKDYIPLIDYLESSLALINSEVFFAQVTGQPVIMAESHRELIRSAGQGYGLSFLVLLSIMMLFTRSLVLGFMLMIPNLLPLFLVVAAMPLLSIPLDILSMLVVSVAMGLVVDDTVHMTSAFQKERSTGRDIKGSLEVALSSAGRAMFLTTVVLVAGFQVLIFSNFESVFTFGWLTSAVMILGLIADLLVAPAILMLYSEAEQTNYVKRLFRKAGTSIDARP